MSDIQAMLQALGVPCGTTHVLLDTPDVSLSIGFDGMQAPNVVMTYETGTLQLNVGDPVTVDGQPYVVRTEPRKVDDGKLTEVGLK